MPKVSKTKLQNLKRGQLIKVPFHNKVLDAIVIEPNGLAQGQPSIGLGFQMIAKHQGISASSLSTWLIKESDIEGVRNNVF